MTIHCARFPCRGKFIRPPSSASGAPTRFARHWPGAFRRSRGGLRVLARDQMLAARTLSYDSALSSAGTTGFASHGDSVFLIAKKVSKNACPCTGLGVPGSLRSTSLIPSLLRGSARKGHPYRRRLRPYTALAASMPLAPLSSDSIRPSERGVRCRLIVCSSVNKQSVFRSLFENAQKFWNSSSFGSVGWKTAKHFPPRSTQESSVHFRHDKRWVSFALPTLHIALTTVSLHARSDTTGLAPFRRPSTGCVEGQAVRHPTRSCRERHANPDRRLRQAAVNSNRTSKRPFVCA